MSVMVNQLDIIAHNQCIAHYVRITGTGMPSRRAPGPRAGRACFNAACGRNSIARNHAHAASAAGRGGQGG
jgi:hypothetical protein